MTVLPDTMATRNRILTTAKAPERALRQAESDQPATDPAPFFFLVRKIIHPGIRSALLRILRKGACCRPNSGLRRIYALNRRRAMISG